MPVPYPEEFRRRAISLVRVMTSSRAERFAAQAWSVTRLKLGMHRPWHI